ncbi:MAG: class I SAM-dependent methyltransferase [Halobacteriovoraceae bacterium]|jgi:SAM-dependent methyltransferase|nr:class I SAM-dependent methyltransferase [Halobacteriovoraceae bacterium]MBT5095860.1 class I SAM-dependent methyltransferase [Halobacteriovoraceae bacterium]
MLRTTEEYHKMAAVEQRLWWYKSLHELVAHSISNFYSRKNPEVVDAGCGTGGCSLFLKENGIADLSGFDISEEAVEICHKNGLTYSKGDLKLINQYYQKDSKDIVICNDVLYFFDNKECTEILNKIHQVLRPGGLAILNLPALKAFSGSHDISVGNPGNRYSMRVLDQIIDPAIFSIRQTLFWPFLLSPLIFLIRLKQRIWLRVFKDYKFDSDIDLPHPLINKILLAIVRFENRWLPFKPWGSSLFVVLEAK